MNEKRILATHELAREIKYKADTYGGGALVQSLLNYLKRHSQLMKEQERENIIMAFEAGITAGLEATRFPMQSGEWYFEQNYEDD